MGRMEFHDPEARRRYIDAHPRPDELFEQHHRQHEDEPVAGSARFLAYAGIATILFWGGAAVWWVL